MKPPDLYKSRRDLVRRAFGSRPPECNRYNMRGLIVLCVVLAVVWADDGCDCKSRSKRDSGGFAYTLTSVMADSTTFRINDLIKTATDLEHKIEAKEKTSYSKLVEDLEHAVEHLEDPLCHEHEFSCGRYSGQCVPDLLVCDHHSDCINGHDEDESVCHDPSDEGRVWKGRIHWTGCRRVGHSDIQVVLTGSKRINSFPSRIKVTAVVSVIGKAGVKKTTKTFKAEGFYNYANKHLNLEPSAGSHAYIDMACDLVDSEHASCHFESIGDGHDCGTAIMYRGDH